MGLTNVLVVITCENSARTNKKVPLTGAAISFIEVANPQMKKSLVTNDAGTACFSLYDDRDYNIVVEKDYASSPVTLKSNIRLDSMGYTTQGNQRNMFSFNVTCLNGSPGAGDTSCSCHGSGEYKERYIYGNSTIGGSPRQRKVRLYDSGGNLVAVTRSNRKKNGYYQLPVTSNGDYTVKYANIYGVLQSVVKTVSDINKVILHNIID